MHILLTGGAGFIGSAVAKKLIERGDDVTIVDDFNDYYDSSLKEDRIKVFLKGLSFDLHRVDIADRQALKKVFENSKFDKIVHLAAQAGVRYSLENPYIYERTNILGTLNLLELAKEFQIKDFIFASSSSVYGGNQSFPSTENEPVNSPVSLYASTKRSGELMCYTYHHLFGIHIAALRFFTVYGPWGRPDMALFIFTKAILEGKPIEVFHHGKAQKDFTFIDDIVRGVISVIDSKFSYEIINLGNNKPTKLLDFISIIEKNTGRAAEKKLLPPPPGDVQKSYADVSKAKKLLGWEPKVGIDEGIKKFVEWYREYYRVSNKG